MAPESETYLEKEPTFNKVLVTLEYPPTVKGGIQHTVLSLAEYVAQQEYEVNLLFPDKTRFHLHESLEDLPVRIWPIQTLGKSWPLDQVPTPESLKLALATISPGDVKAAIVHSPDMLGLATIRALDRHLRSITTIVWNSPLLFPVESFNELPRTELIKHLATEPLYWLRKQLWLLHHLEKYRSVFNSETNLETFRAVFGGYPEGPYEVIYPTSPLCTKGMLEISRPETIDERLRGRFTILTTGRITRKKGIERLKKLIFEIDNNFAKMSPNNELGFVIAGATDSSYAKEATKGFAELEQSLRNSICITIPNPSDLRLRSIYDNSDIFIIPSVIEGFGLVTVEAGYHGLPVIGLNKFGSAEVIPKFGIYGHLINDLNPEVSPEEINKLVNFIAEFQALTTKERALLKTQVYNTANRHFNPEKQHRNMTKFVGL